MPRRELPAELWLLVFQNLLPTRPQNVEPRRLKPDYTDPLRMPDLTPVLRWCLIAAPLLYSTPTVDQLGDFMLGFDRPLLPGKSIADPQDQDLLASGNTKLPLLRCTRRLRLVSKNVWQDPDSPTNTVERWAAVEAESFQWEDAMDSALDTLCRLDVSKILPQLEGVSLSSPDQYRGDLERYLPLGSKPWPLGPVIMRQLRPRLMCGTGSSSEVFGNVLPRALDWQNRVLPKANHIHADFHFDFEVMWGTTNIVFVDFESMLEEVERGELLRSPIKLHWLVDWACLKIGESVPAWHPATLGASILRDMDNSTRIDFHGLVNRQVLNWAHQMQDTLVDDFRSHWTEDDARDEGPEGLEEEVRELVGLGLETEEAEPRLVRFLEKYIRLDRRRNITGGTDEFWSRVVNVSKSKDAVSCSACGV